ncbi:MAG: hypothetical protein WD887_01555 [Candidatus Saccharimonadales bacterium]
MQPSSPKPGTPAPPDQYGFILNNDPKPKPRFKLPLPKLPKPLLFVLGGSLIILIILVLAAAIFGGRSGSPQPLVDVMARSQEIIRVTDIAVPEVTDNGTKTLAATVKSSLASEQAELNTYLSGTSSPVEPQSLTAYLDEAIDAEFATAAKNNELDIAYIRYLKENLSAYSGALQSAYQTAAASAKPILEEAYESIQIILSAPQF